MQPLSVLCAFHFSPTVVRFELHRTKWTCHYGQTKAPQCIQPSVLKLISMQASLLPQVQPIYIDLKAPCVILTMYFNHETIHTLTHQYKAYSLSHERCCIFRIDCSEFFFFSFLFFVYFFFVLFFYSMRFCFFQVFICSPDYDSYHD